MTDNPYGNPNPYDQGNPYGGGGQQPPDTGGPNPYTSAGGGGGGPQVRTITDPYQPGELQVVSRSSLGASPRRTLGAASAPGRMIEDSGDVSGGARWGAVAFLLFAALLTVSKGGLLAAVLAAALLGVSRSRFLSDWARTSLNVLIVYLGLGLVVRVVLGVVDFMSNLLLVDFSLYWLRTICSLLLLLFAVLAFTRRTVRLPRILSLIGR